MRITNNMLQSSYLYNLSASYERVYEKEAKTITNKEINTPSDNPLGAAKAVTLRKKIDEINQYQTNIDNAKAYLTSTNTTLTQIADIMENISTLNSQGASGAYDENDMASIADQVNQLLEDLYSASNTKTDSGYIFGGTNTETAPYTAVRDENGDIISVTTSGTSGSIERSIAENVRIKVNVNGDEVFGSDQSLFNTLIEIRDSLASGDTNALINKISEIDDAVENIYNIQATVGTKQNRVDSASTRAEKDLTNFKNLLSGLEDADSETAIAEYQMELVYLESTMEAGSRLLGLGLEQFLS